MGGCAAVQPRAPVHECRARRIAADTACGMHESPTQHHRRWAPCFRCGSARGRGTVLGAARRHAFVRGSCVEPGPEATCSRRVRVADRIPTHGTSRSGAPSTRARAARRQIGSRDAVHLEYQRAGLERLVLQNSTVWPGGMMRPHYACLACCAANEPHPGWRPRLTHPPRAATRLRNDTERGTMACAARAPPAARGIIGRIESFDFAARKVYSSS
jgi:hypothetical protein